MPGAEVGATLGGGGAIAFISDILRLLRS
jgi:hypothetical protein